MLMNDCGCLPQNDYASVGFSGDYPGLSFPGGASILTFTSTDFSSQISAYMGREIGFSAFEQMGSTLAAGAEAMIILAMNQCNAILSQNEALISSPSSTSSTTKTTIYHQKIDPSDTSAPKGATDEYVQNWTDSNGLHHQQITYVDANGKEIDKRDFILDNNSALTVTLKIDLKGSGHYANGDTVTINGQDFILIDTGQKDCDNHPIFALHMADAKGKDTGHFAGTISFNFDGSVAHSNLIDYSTIGSDRAVPGFLNLASQNSFKWSFQTPITYNSDGSFTLNGVNYQYAGSFRGPDVNFQRLHGYDDGGYTNWFYYKDADGNILWVPKDEVVSKTDGTPLLKAGNYKLDIATSASYSKPLNAVQWKAEMFYRDEADDQAGYEAFKSAAGEIIYAHETDVQTGNGAIYFYEVFAPDEMPDAFATFNGCGKDLKVVELDGKTPAPTTDSKSTNTQVTQNTADPLTTMAAVFKYAEVYAEAMTMMSTYEQTNIDDFKNRPH